MATSMTTDEPPSSSSSNRPRSGEKNWLEKILGAFSHEPKSRDELLDIIKDAAENKVVDAEALSIIEGALDVSNQQVREIMIPRSQMVVVSINDQPKEFLPKVIESGHSRFPVVGESIDDMRGILLAKDLLPLVLKGVEEFHLEDIIRPANIIPESKRLNILLREFRENRYHMAVVIDEYGGVSGVVTIEDILEEIVGDIEDETDEDEEDSFIRKVSDNDYVVKALTPIEDFNEYFDCEFSDEEFDTIGGLIMQSFGHLPGRDEMTRLGDFKFRVLYADNRQIHLLRVSRLDKPAEEDG
ncbi:transporter associated domain-containing protein [Microbulbifer bruguierae]|uniref:Magnesium and cobalt efflux protein CorC n=1 Tax=Microbulbifer bruguierae TaxID=3029061 RepID=A0ABY8NF51_9GAMM|nr:transporter associated domain-containing protein [Microbulbifer bruguierae]WGL17561.1 transporter associated domain-containing protein [Microbulbifer bruguierae]